METWGLGARVAQVRRRRSLTQAQLAEAAGVSVDLVCKLEAGAKDGVRLGSLNALARALAVPTSTFLEMREGPVMDAGDLLRAAAADAPFSSRPHTARCVGDADETFGSMASAARTAMSSASPNRP